MLFNHKQTPKQYHFWQVCEASWLCNYFSVVVVVIDGVAFYIQQNVKMFYLKCYSNDTHLKWKLMTSRLNVPWGKFSVILLFLNYWPFYTNIGLVYFFKCEIFLYSYRYQRGIQSLCSKYSSLIFENSYIWSLISHMNNEHTWRGLSGEFFNHEMSKFWFFYFWDFYLFILIPILLIKAMQSLWLRLHQI